MSARSVVRDRANNPDHRRAVMQLRRGDLVVVRWGAGGAQLAEVLGPPRVGSWSIPVRKWRRRSRTWTLRVFVRVGEVLGIPRVDRRVTLRRWGVELDPLPQRAAAAAAELGRIYGRRP